jgi:hypothetical protein
VKTNHALYTTVSDNSIALYNYIYAPKEMKVDILKTEGKNSLRIKANNGKYLSINNEFNASPVTVIYSVQSTLIDSGIAEVEFIEFFGDDNYIFGTDLTQTRILFIFFLQ